MRVLKFGGSSIGTPENLLKVKSIVESRQEPIILVVSALAGVTDQLIKATHLATSADDSFREVLAEIRSLHNEMCEQVVPDPSDRAAVINKMAIILDRLDNICEGIFLIQAIEKSRNEIASVGERLSSLIVTAAIPGTVTYDSLKFIKTRNNGHISSVDTERTNECILKAFQDYDARKGIAVVPGFISTDSETGEISTLGRGGSTTPPA